MTPVEMTLDDSWAVWCRDDGGGMWSYDRAVMLCPTSFGDTGGQPAMRHPGGRANISRVEAASHAISRWQYEHQQPDHWSHHKTAAGENMASGMWNVWTISIIYLVVVLGSSCRVRTVWRWRCWHRHLHLHLQLCIWLRHSQPRLRQSEHSGDTEHNYHTPVIILTLGLHLATFITPRNAAGRGRWGEVSFGRMSVMSVDPGVKSEESNCWLTPRWGQMCRLIFSLVRLY